MGSTPPPTFPLSHTLYSIQGIYVVAEFHGVGVCGYGIRILLLVMLWVGMATGYMWYTMAIIAYIVHNNGLTFM